MIRVFIGYDPREAIAFHVCADSIIRNSSQPVEITPLYLPHLNNYKELHTDGSNQFIYSRFLVPALCDYHGFALFMDGDMVVNGDVSELFDIAASNYSVSAWVCKHDYKTNQPIKYLGNKNQDYPRKNWSSVILWNCASFPNRKLTPEYVQNATGAELHRFKWIPDERIGEIPLDWNWLVGEYEPNPKAKLHHYTLGVPEFPEYANSDHSKEWKHAKTLMLQCGEQP